MNSSTISMNPFGFGSILVLPFSGQNNNFTQDIQLFISDRTLILDDSAKPWIIFNNKGFKGSMLTFFMFYSVFLMLGKDHDYGQ